MQGAGASQVHQIYPGFDTFGGLISPNAANRSGLAITNPAIAAANAANNAMIMPQPSSNDPIRPLTLAPELSPQFNLQLSQQASPNLPAQLAQFGNNGAAQTGGQTSAASGITPTSLLQQVGNPAARDSTTDPIRPLTLVPSSPLPLGNSATGLPGAPLNRPSSSVSQKDPIRPLMLIPTNGNGS